MKRTAFKCWDAFFVHCAVCFFLSPLKHGIYLCQHIQTNSGIKAKGSNTQAPLCRMLLSVCMKDYVARSYGHTPRKLPLKGVPSRATSRFIAYQALLLYTMKSFLSIEFQKFLRKNNKLFHCVFVHNAQLLTLFHFSPTR